MCFISYKHLGPDDVWQAQADLSPQSLIIEIVAEHVFVNQRSSLRGTQVDIPGNPVLGQDFALNRSLSSMLVNSFPMYAEC